MITLNVNNNGIINQQNIGQQGGTANALADSILQITPEKFFQTVREEAKEFPILDVTNTFGSESHLVKQSLAPEPQVDEETKSWLDKAKEYTPAIKAAVVKIGIPAIKILAASNPIVSSILTVAEVVLK